MRFVRYRTGSCISIQYSISFLQLCNARLQPLVLALQSYHLRLERYNLFLEHWQFVQHGVNDRTCFFTICAHRLLGGGAERSFSTRSVCSVLCRLILWLWKSFLTAFRSSASSPGR